MSGETRTLTVIGQFHPIVGGAELQCKLLNEELIALGNSTEIITAHRTGLAKQEFIGRIPVKRAVPFRAGPLKKFLLGLSVMAIIVQRRRDFEIVHLHGASYLALFCGAACALTKHPLVIKFVNSGMKFDIKLLSRSRVVYWIFKIMMARVQPTYICTTPTISTELDKFLGVDARREQIPNGVSIASAKPRRIRPFLGSRLSLIMVSRLVPQKNHEFILECLSHLKRDFQLHLVGAGPQAEKLMRQSEELGIDGRVSFHGELVTTEVREIMRAGDLFLLPSLTEGLSNSLLESMSEGLPVLTSDIAPNRYVLGTLEKSLCYSLEVEGWVGFLDGLDAFKLQELSDAVYDRALTFSIKRVAEKYSSLYKQLATAS